MGDKKVTIMVLKADLQCSKCYKKVKKVLCKYPQIQDQVFDEKTNTVRIKVVCCSPEKIRDKLCCKGEGSIKSIEILEPEKPKVKPPPEKKPEKPKEPEKKPEKPKEPEKKPEKPKEPEKKPENPKEAEKKPENPKEPEKKPEKSKEPEKPKELEKPKEPEKPKEQEKPKEPEKPAEPKPEKPKVTFVEPPKAPQSPEPVSGYPYVPSFGMCCRECYGGHAGGPCHQPGYGEVRYYDGYYGRPVYDSWGSGGGCDNRVYRSRCTDYICEENPAAPCSIM